MENLPQLEYVLLHKEQSTLTITLNRPEVLNAFNDALGSDLLVALKFAEKDSDTRCVVLTGAGKGFCAGEDLKQHLASPKPLGDTLRKRYHPIIQRIRTLEKPVIARINGVAAGAGVALALACDIRIAVDTGKFAMAFVKIALVPDSGMFWFLPRLIGYARAFEWMATGDVVSAQKALEWGMVNQLASTEQLDEAVQQWAVPFATGPTAAYGLIKRGLQAGMDRSFEQSLEQEAYLQELAGNLSDHNEGVHAFLEKREARFSGR
ncbi:MAG: enoyl-CoA hydratase-related protein [bacterium]|nr:enoyl-CoA hydratase-related protein [bacterium]